VVQDTVLKVYSLKRRLLSAYAGVLFVFIILFGVALTWGLKSSFNHMLHTSLNSVIIDLKYDLRHDDPIPSGIIDSREEFAVSPVYIETWQIEENKKKRILYSKNMKNEHLPIILKKMTMYESVDIDFILESDGELADESAILAETVKVDGKTYLISVATPIDGVDDLMGDFISLFGVLGILLYLIAFYMGYKMLNKLLIPMQSITATVNEITQHDLTKRVPLPKTKDDFFILAQTFNLMLERIEDAFVKVKKFNINVSHELKTPITIMRGEAEVALLKERNVKEYRDVLQSIIDENILMEQIIESMLLLSKSDTRSLKKQMVPFIVNDLILEVIERKKVQADLKSISIIFNAPKAITLIAEVELLQRALSNLLDNAIKYTPDNQEKKIMILLAKDGDKTFIEISDEGIGINEEHLAHIWEPFYRVDDSHSKTVPGHGLGLALVKWIIELHNADIALESNKTGTKVSITF